MILATPHGREVLDSLPGRNGIPFSQFHNAIGLWPGEWQTIDIDLDDPEDKGNITNASFFGSPYEKITPSEAARRAEKLAVSTAKNYNALHDILDRYEEVVRSRWMKRSGPQRERLLLEVWPGMTPHHRPDIRAYRIAPKRRSPDTKDAYMFPYMNLEDLKHGASILRLLNARGRNHPAVFAALDQESIHVGIWSRVILPVALPQRPRSYSMSSSEGDTHNHSQSPLLLEESDEDDGGPFFIDLETRSLDQYGRLKPYEPYRSKPHSERPNVAQGLLVLHIQNSVLESLVKLCKLLLQEKKLDGDLTPVPVLPEPPALTISIGNVQWPSLVDFARDSPYLVPGEANLPRLLSLVQSRLAEWKDYAVAMREDPQFFANVVGDWSEHSGEWVKDVSGRVHPDLQNGPPKQEFWDRTLASAINEIYEGLYVWTFFSSELEKIMSMIDRSNFGRREDNADFLKALESLRYLLEERVIKKAKIELMRRFPPSPPMRAKFIQYTNTQRFELRRGLDRKDDLWWLISESKNEKSPCPLDMVAVELSRLIQTDKKQKERITAFVARFIADLGFAREVRRQLRLLCPSVFNDYGKSVGVKMEEDQELRKECLQTLKPMTDLMFITGPAHAKEKFLRLGAIGNPTSGRFIYPVNKKRTQENHEMMQVAEQNLDAVWDEYDNHLQKHLCDESIEALRRLTPKKEEIQRTPDWIEPDESAKETTRQAPVTAIPDFGQHNEEEKLSFRAADLSITAKVKTRGQPAPQPPTESTAQPPSTPAPPQTPLFLLKKRAYRVFTILYHQPSAQQAPGEISWADFVYALSSIGFLPEKLYGSVWRFVPGPALGAKLGVENAINFHEPHPQDKMAFHMARRYGRRLNRVYGLEASSFGLVGVGELPGKGE